MNFNWFKKLFKRNENIGLTELNTTNFHVLRLGKLNGQNKERAISFLKEINIDNYESVLKYSEELKDKTNQDIDLLFYKANELKSCLDSINSISELKAYFNESSIFQGYYNQILFRINLLKEEIDLLKTDILKTEITAELKLIAFNEFIRQIKRKNYSFNKNARKSERVRNKNRLEEENERLKKLLMVIRYNLEVTSRITKLNEYGCMITNIENYVQSGRDYSSIVDFPITKGGVYSVIRYEDSSYHRECRPSENSELIKSEFHGIIERYEMIEKYNQYTSFPNPFDINFLKSLKDEVEERINYKSNRYNEILNKLAKYNYLLDKFAYLHRFDYKKIINEMNELINKYLNTSSSKWNHANLFEATLKYDRLIQLYSIVCSHYVNENIKNELKEVFLKLDFLLCSLHSFDLDYDFETAGEFERIIYFNKTIKDLYTKIINDLPYKEFFRQFKIKDTLFDIIHKNQTHYLVDFIRGDYSHFEPILHDYSLMEYAKNYPTSENESNQVWGKNLWFRMDAEKLVKQRVKINESARSRLFCESSFEDCFHYIKNLGINEKKAKDLLYDEFYDCPVGIKGPLKFIILEHWFSEYEKIYDDRIMIMPSYMTVTINPELLPNHNYLDNKRTIKALYLQEVRQINDIRKYIKDFKTVEYILVKKSAFDEYNESCRVEEKMMRGVKLNYDLSKFNENVKIVVVPDEVKYQELTDYINLEDKKKKLVLDK